MFLRKIYDIAEKFLIRVPMIDRSWLELYKKEIGIEYRLDQSHFVEYTFQEFVKEINDADLKIESSIIHFGEIWAVIKK